MKISPLFYVGIVVFILPVLLNIFNINIPFLNQIGMILIVLGIIHTIALKVKEQ